VVRPLRLKSELIEFDYLGLRKIISGGQCGADRGGLEAAKTFGLETGGTAPLGFRTANGPDPSLAEFGLVEDSSTHYRPRTLRNILDSDGTVIFASNFTSSGTELTINLCKKHKKPVYLVHLPMTIDRWIPFVNDMTARFIIKHRIDTLNVAGNRDRAENKNFHRDSAKGLLEEVLGDLQALEFLNVPTK